MLTSALAMLVACTDGFSSIETLILKDNISGMVSAPSGDYKSIEGQLFRVSTNGGAALTVRSDDGKLCLRFWRQKLPVSENRLLRLDGQICQNRTFGDLDWHAMYSYNKPNFFIIYAPGTFTQDNILPIEIHYSPAQKD